MQVKTNVIVDVRPVHARGSWVQIVTPVNVTNEHFMESFRKLFPGGRLEHVYEGNPGKKHFYVTAPGASKEDLKNFELALSEH